MTDDALRSLVLAVNLLDVTRICVVRHTDCALAGTTNDDLRRRIEDAGGREADDWDFLPMTDADGTLR